MRAYLIDPVAKTVTEIQHDGKLESIYAAIDCTTIDAVQVAPTDVIYVDEEGLLKAGQSFSQFRGLPTPIAGKALWVGTDSEGNDGDPGASLASVAEAVSWLTASEVVRNAAAGKYD